jgi:hypothetical protein
MTPHLLEDAFAPITWHIGYLNVPIDHASQVLMDWRADLGQEPRREELRSDLPTALRLLEPLVGGARPRELLIQTGPTWTAYFDCLLQGTDPISAIGYLAQRIGCVGMAVASVHQSDRVAAVFKPPARSFTLFGAAPTHFLNHIRSVASIYDGDRWEFIATGTPQPFEHLSAYLARRIQDRLTPEMLQRYGRALVGIDVFEASDYGPRGVLVRSNDVIPKDAKIMSIDDAHRWYGLGPPGSIDLP